MIPQAYRFVIVNNTGQTLSFTEGGRLTITIIGWFIDPSTGKVTYEDIDLIVPSPEFDSGVETIVNGDEVIFPENLNNTNKYLGLLVQMQVTHDLGAIADGTLDLYFAGGPGSGSLPTDGTNYAGAETSKLQQVGSLTWVPDGDDQIARSNVFNL